MNTQPSLPAGVFESFRLWMGKPVAWHLHQQRMLAGAHLLNTELPERLFSSALREVDYKWAQLGQPEHARARVKVRCVPSVAVAVAVEALTYSLLEDSPERLHVGLHQPATPLLPSPLCWHKTLARAAYDEATAWGQAHGLDDVLLVANGVVADSTRSNVIFLLPDGRLVTPAPNSGRLAGTALARVREALHQLGHVVYEEPVPVPVALNANAVLLTNAVRGLQWAQQLEGRSIPLSEDRRAWLQQVRAAAFGKRVSTQ
jgi:branched-subunit amino acid aminotransferase/4-amino-4-deoxychorismate lyase